MPSKTSPFSLDWSSSQFPIWGATLGMVLRMVFRWTSTDQSTISLTALRQIGYSPYYLGLATLEYAVVLVPLIVLARTAWFKETLTQPWQQQSTKRLLIVFSIIQVIFTLYRYNLIRLDESWVEFGVLVPLLAGLIGGWRVGLGVGLVAALTNGGLDYGSAQLFENDPHSLTVYITDHLLESILPLVPIWVGFVAGWWVQAYSPIRPKLTLPSTLILGILLYFSTGILIYIFFNDWTDFVTDRLMPNLLLVSLTLAAFVTLIRFVQDESLRRETEAQRLMLSETQLALANTELALVQAELRALHAQINPHFLFNSLNTIRYFIRTEPTKARTLLTRLSQVFQRILHAGETVPLRDEIETIKAYLELEAARLEERLNIVWTNLAEAQLEVSVPSLILQPIVENAIGHGIAPKPEGGTIHILIDRITDDLLLQVSDDGVGFDSHTPGDGDSIALKNITRRLTMRYGERYAPTIQSVLGQGTKVTLRIPIEETHA